MECLDQLKEHGVFCDLFFTLGVPYEKEEDLSANNPSPKEDPEIGIPM